MDSARASAELGKVARVSARANRLPRLGQGRSSRLEGERATALGLERREPRIGEQVVHGGQCSEGIFLLHFA